MPSIGEAIGSKTPLASDLAAGVDAISSNQEITFQRYVRLVLPLDGYAFWVKQQLVSKSALLNVLHLNERAVPLNAATQNGQPAYSPENGSTLTVKGSLHYSTETRQEESETYSVNRVLFTAQEMVQDLNDVGPNTLYLAEFDGIRFAFSTRGSYYKQSGLHHYIGYAVYPDMQSQIIDDPRQFDSRELIVSNSLPIWLSLNSYRTPYGIECPLTLYPSFLVPGNLQPPFGAVHIAPESTNAIAAAPSIARNSSHSQLVAERVKITLYGMRNFNALDFVDCVNDFSLANDMIGIMNMPTIRDEKRTQSELNAIAMKKSIEFEVNYYQATARTVARQMIMSAIPSITARD